MPTKSLEEQSSHTLIFQKEQSSVDSENLAEQLYDERLLSYIHTYIPWIHKCVTKTEGCGTSHKYTKYTNLQCKILQTFYKNNIINDFKH